MRRVLVCCGIVMLLTVGGSAFAREPSGTQAARQEAQQRQAALLAALWPQRVAVLSGGPGPARDWAEADRQQVWTRALLQGAGLGAAPATALPAKP